VRADLILLVGPLSVALVMCATAVAALPRGSQGGAEGGTTSSPASACA